MLKQRPNTFPWKPERDDVELKHWILNDFLEEVSSDLDFTGWKCSCCPPLWISGSPFLLSALKDLTSGYLCVLGLHFLTHKSTVTEIQGVLERALNVVSGYLDLSFSPAEK